MAAQGPLISWVATHRRHHEMSDHDGDPHSPHVRTPQVTNRLSSFWHAHAGWLWKHDMPQPLVYAPDLLSDATLVRINNLYFVWVMLGLLLPALIAGTITWSWYGALTGMLWGGFVRMFVTTQFIWSINSICHMFGSRPFDTGDCSCNNAWLALFTFGESWHNNHHAVPSKAAFGLKWWQIDLRHVLITMLKAVRMAWDVK